MNGTVTKLYDINSISIPKEMLIYHVDEKDIQSQISCLSTRYAEKIAAETAESGDCVICRADKNSYPDGRKILLFTGINLPAAEKAAAEVLKKSVGDTFSTELNGKAVTLSIEKIIRYKKVPITDSLIKSIGIDGVSTLAQYEEYLRTRALENLQMERHKEIVRYILDCMVSESSYVYDQTEAEQYLEKALHNLLNDLGDDQPEESPEEIKEQIMNQLKQGWMAEAFAKERGLVLNMDEIEANADQMIEMMRLMGEEVPDRREIIEMARQDEAMNLLFDEIDKKILAEEDAV